MQSNQEENKEIKIKELEKVECPECGLKILKNNLSRHISNIHKNEKKHCCEYCDFKCNQPQNLKKHSCYIKKQTQIKPDENLSKYSVEYNIQNRLEKELKGHKISCSFGRVDLITSDTIIEIKKWDDHKKAIGQILGYSVYFPKHKKRIHFFGSKPTDNQMKGITDVCKHFKIEITEEI